MKLIIIRGPSGSGKSTIAQALGGFANVSWLEADMYFCQNGKYNFDARRLGEAHRWCQDCVRHTIQIGRDDNPMFSGGIIVSNTSTTLAEANVYVKIAQEEGIPYEVIRTPRPWNIDDLFSRNEHNVPRAVLEKQVARYVPVNGEREWSDLSVFNGVK